MDDLQNILAWGTECPLGGQAIDGPKPHSLPPRGSSAWEPQHYTGVLGFLSFCPSHSSFCRRREAGGGSRGTSIHNDLAPGHTSAEGAVSATSSEGWEQGDTRPCLAFQQVLQEPGAWEWILSGAVSA